MKPLPFSALSYASTDEFLQDTYFWLTDADSDFSEEKMAKACDLKSRNHAIDLMSGVQKPNLVQLKSITAFLGLSEEERDYLHDLHEKEVKETTQRAEIKKRV